MGGEGDKLGCQPLVSSIGKCTFSLSTGGQVFKIRFPFFFQLKYLENITKVHERTISDLEDENVQLSKEHEERQLLWEQREVELERMIDKLEKQQEQLADAAAKFEEATGSIPDHNLPVANQLEMAITKIKEHIRIIVGTREENKVLKKVRCILLRVVCKLG